jgi:hypothetical protein
MPHVTARLGRDGMADVAISEWMAASPIYTKRMQELLRFEGETVETIFKGFQFDIGAPHEFMDFRMEVHDDHHGEFHLDHCGALMDVEPMGEDYVVAMCHHIEDPTFDATAAATNPRARIRPVHRPPRVPADRTPHCRWTVTIDDEREPIATPAGALLLASSQAAQLEIASPDPTLSVEDGRTDYAHRFDPDFVAEDLSSATLSASLDEFALQGHLLSRAYLLALAERATPDDTRALGIKQAVGIAGLTSKRLARALGAGDDLAGIASVLSVHPLFLPRAYVAVEFVATEDGIVLTLPPSPSRADGDGLTWPALLADDGDMILASLVTCVSPGASVERLPGDDDGTVRWSISVDPDAPTVQQPGEVTLAEFSTGADFTFRRGSTSRRHSGTPVMGPTRTPPPDSRPSSS